MDNNKDFKTESEIHYSSLISYFKHLVWLTVGVLSLVSVIAGILIFQDRAEMRNELNDIKSLAEKAIKNTTDFANNKINEIQSSAEQIALDEARLRVSEAFEKNSIREMIDVATKDIITKSVKNEIDIEVNKGIKKIKNDLANFSKISDAASKMRRGLISGLIDLRIMTNNIKDDYLREIAKNYYDEICQDYDDVHTQGIKIRYPDSLKLVVAKDIVYDFHIIKTDIPNLIELINSKYNLDNIAIGYIMLRIKTNKNFEMFNINQVNNWWRENKNNYSVETGNEKN